ncbi:MAG: hypothetical protein G01um10148_716 [Parcubacteria group bacterium Gr01-1014_8]|nr:MAG: hypothetical protein G01um10148_716 [Parcubacteria group bacterium Gr01-1014_8]
MNVHSIKKTALVILFAGALVLPISVFAQADDSVLLRDEIRASLLSDPRSSELSESELAVLVESLAGEAEKQGVAEDFLPEQTFVPSSFQSSAGPIGQLSMPALYGVILVSLALTMVLLKHLYDIHHRKENASLASAADNPPATS